MPTKKSIEDRGVNLLIIRETYTDKSTIGKLFVNGEYFCYTLELPYRDNQRRISCIPSGKYKVRLRLARESATRDYLHLLVQDVPDRTYIVVPPPSSFGIGNILNLLLINSNEYADFLIWSLNSIACNLSISEYIGIKMKLTPGE